MKIAVTGGPGFIGHYILRRLASAGHSLRCWFRPTSDRSGLEDIASSLEWLPGELNDEGASKSLVADCDAVVHAALYRPGLGSVERKAISSSSPVEMSWAHYD